VTNDQDRSGDGFSTPPLHLDDQEIPAGATQCDNAKAIGYARTALSYLQHSDSGFPEDYSFPKPSLYRCALLGTHTVHFRNFEYDTETSLRQLVEKKINSSNSHIFLMPVLASQSYYCFKLSRFTYDVLDELKDKTFAIDFVLLLPEKLGGFVFFEDNPACYMFFERRADFEEGFMSPEKAMDIYEEQMAQWQHYRSDTVTLWMRKVNHALRSSETTPED
jgi:hypothetical protein